MELIIGSHVSYKSDTQLLGSVKETLEYNANTFMFYTGAPQNTKRSEINIDLLQQAHNLMKDNNIDINNVIIHAPYIVNLANPINFDFSVSFLKQELKRCNTLGITKMVLHPGSAVNVDRDVAINNIIDGLNLILDNNYNVTILLETMAGKGNEIGKTFEEIQEIISCVNNYTNFIYSEKIGVCLDTCHVYDAGYDIVNNFDEIINEFDKIIGLSKLKAVHLNDSMNPLGSHKDRHACLGHGCIGFDAIKRIVKDSFFANIPFILETPNDLPGYATEIKLIKEIF